MTQLVVPALDRVPWPSLGGQLVHWLEGHLIFGPGDLRGRPAILDEEQRFFTWRMYEIHPRGSARAGKRRFQRCALSLRKGLRKTEFAAWITAAELHPDAPVRFDHWARKGEISPDGYRFAPGEPVGRGVNDPYIPLVAYTEEQSEELVFGALKAIIEEGPLARDFDCSLERIVRIDGKGKAVPLANSPSARDGARTTFENFDETHRLTHPSQRAAHNTMLGNLLKRPLADPWALETTTMYAPGEGSVAEGTHDYARKVDTGAIQNPRLFFFHRQAAANADISTREGLTTAVIEASGPLATPWSDIDGIAAQWDDPDADLALLDRTWLNRPVRSKAKAFDVEAWKLREELGRTVPGKAQIVLGFAGSQTRDGSSLVATEITSGYQWPIKIWERDVDVETWEIDVADVDAAVTEAFGSFTVWRMYAAPHDWEGPIREWAGRYGKERVLDFSLHQERRMAAACASYATAITAGELSQPGDPELTAHVGNAFRRRVSALDDDGRAMWVIQKERPDSVHHIHAARAAVLSWAVRLQALREGVGQPVPDPGPYFVRVR